MFARVQLTGDQFVDRGAEARAQQARLTHRRAGERDHPRHVEFAGAQQPPERDHVLVADVPDAALHGDRVQAVDVPADQTRRMRASELLELHPGGCIDRFAGRTAQVNRPGADFGERLQSLAEVVGARADHQRRRRRVRPRIGRGDEYRFGGAVGRRHVAEGPLAQRGPQPGLLHQRPHAADVEPGGATAAERGECQLPAGAVIGRDVDHHRDQRPALAAMDR